VTPAPPLIRSPEELFSLGLKRDLIDRGIFEEALMSGEVQQRVIAARALGWIRNPACAPALIYAIHDPVAEVRRWAIASLSLSWCLDAEKALVQRFSIESDSAVRAAILRTLGWQRMHNAALLCMNALKDDPEPQVRGEATRALGRIDPITYRSHLLFAARDSASLVRQHAIRSLMECMSESSTNQVLSTLLACAKDDEDPESRAVAIRGLTHHDSREAYECLILALADPNPCVRANAAVALGQRGDLNALIKLQQTRDDPHSEVRTRVHEAMILLNLNLVTHGDRGDESSRPEDV